jgi:hypothetical protein
MSRVLIGQLASIRTNENLHVIDIFLDDLDLFGQPINSTTEFGIQRLYSITEIAILLPYSTIEIGISASSLVLRPTSNPCIV